MPPVILYESQKREAQAYLLFRVYNNQTKLFPRATCFLLTKYSKPETIGEKRVNTFSDISQHVHPTRCGLVLGGLLVATTEYASLLQEANACKPPRNGKKKAESPDSCTQKQKTRQYRYAKKMAKNVVRTRREKDKIRHTHYTHMQSTSWETLQHTKKRQACPKEKKERGAHLPCGAQLLAEMVDDPIFLMESERSSVLLARVCFFFQSFIAQHERKRTKAKGATGGSVQAAVLYRTGSASAGSDTKRGKGFPIVLVVHALRREREYNAQTQSDQS